MLLAIINFMNNEKHRQGNQQISSLNLYLKQYVKYVHFNFFFLQTLRIASYFIPYAWCDLYVIFYSLAVDF